jgi:tetratricopeptide (TPR) repeat protein
MERTRKIYFIIITILLPFILLLQLEGALRLFGLFKQEPLFISVNKNGQAMYQVNENVANRYFDAHKMAVPKLFPDTFTKNKSKKTLRIFCLGGSTTAGFPFEAQVPFPYQMKTMLKKADPEHQYEVINLGLSAVNSFTVLDFIPDILEMQPDLLVIYMGHNEFYGAYGSASTISIGSNGNLIRFYLKLQKWCIVQGLKRMLTGLTGKPQAPSGDQTLMEKVIADQSIAYGSDKYRQTLTNFEDNLDCILEQAKDATVPVYLGSLASNVRDMPPMESLQDSMVITPIDSLLGRKISDQLGKDSTDAVLNYRIGKYYLRLGKDGEAANYLYRSKDFDRLRFRASEDLNKIIKQMSQQAEINFVDVKKEIEAKSQFNIPGNDLFCDHLHPNPIGYRIMANAFAAAILKKQNINPPPFAENLPHITTLDWEMGLIKIFKLEHRWPFADKPVDFSRYTPYGDSLTARIANAYVYQNHNWPQSHYNLAEIYLKKDRIADARKEYLAVGDFYLDRDDPLKKVAETYLMEGSWDKAISYLQEALKLTDKKGMIYFELAKAQWKLKQIVSAINSIQNAIVAPELNNKQKAIATYYLAGFLLEGKRYTDAKRVLQDALSFDPELKEAQSLLSKLEKMTNAP